MGQTERLGARLRDARLALGLTQTQAAEGIISGAFLSLIESGQRAPSPKVAAALASRLRIPLEPEEATQDPVSAATVSIEVALRMGDWQTAERMLEVLPAESPERWYFHGRICEQRGDSAEAMRLLGRAADAPGAPTALQLRAKLALCRCSRDAGDLHRSVEVGERALADLQADPHADEQVEAELRATLAGTYCETGDLFRAQELTDPRAARGNRDPWSEATQHWSRAMVLQSAGEFAEARAAAFDALDILRTLDRPRSEALLRATAAWISLQTHGFDAREVDLMLRNAEQVLRDTHSRVELAGVLGSRAELAVRCGRTTEARELAEQALVLVGSDDPGLRARITANAASIYAALGETNEAMRRLLTARELLEGSGAKRSAAATWRQMAQTYEDLGALDLTIACLKAATDLLGLQQPIAATLPEESPVQAMVDIGIDADHRT